MIRGFDDENTKKVQAKDLNSTNKLILTLSAF
jgi:hypothetical protein